MCPVHQAVRAMVYCFYSRWLSGWINFSFSLSWWVRQLCLSESLLQERKREVEPSNSAVDIFRQPSTWQDYDDDHWDFLHLSRDSIELLLCLRSFWSCRLQRECLALDSSSKVMPAEDDEERPGGDWISFDTGGFWLSSSVTALITLCSTKAATVAMKPGSLTIFDQCLHYTGCA